MLPRESIKLEINVPVEMRDGTILYADICRPAADGRYPAILTRLWHNKTGLLAGGGNGYLNPIRMVRAGYAVVIQDCRGTGASEGEYYPWRGNIEDGYDSVEWTAAQPWCDGNVGMYGLSHFGYSQWMAAVAQPPHLKAICPAQHPIVSRGEPTVKNGVFRMGNIGVFLAHITSALSKSKLPPQELRSIREHLKNITEDIDKQFRFLPLKDAPVIKIAEKLGMAPFYIDWLTHVDDNEYWKQLSSPAPLEKVIIPVFQMCGWYDIFALGGNLRNYLAMKTRGGSDLARKNQKLVMGPWIHGTELLGTVGELNFGAASTGAFIDMTGMHIRWFDHWLKGIENGITQEPPIRIFVMGDNIWRDEFEWPLARAKYTNYYLHSGGQANSSSGNGILSTERPDVEETDVYHYDPRNPVPTREGGPLDQEMVEKRTDVLVYTSTPLEADTEVTGPITIKLWAASSAVDTDFTSKLVDVWPNGKAYNLIDGIIRARYRESISETKLIEPGKVYEFTIDLGATSNVFKTGHRIRVDISSSNFPMWDRNLNTGHPIGQDAEIKVALQTIHHDKQYPSHIVLPVILR
jgi:putative CocE/NonD family hydrolase